MTSHLLRLTILSITFLVSTVLTNAQPTNLLQNPNADLGTQGWRIYGQATVEKNADNNPCFVVRNGGYFIQDVNLSPDAIGRYALLMARASTERVNPDGAITGLVNLGSLAGKEGLANLAAYSAASAGIISFTKALSREVIGRNIFVNCVAPGPIDTDMIRDLGVDVVEKMIADSPMQRLGSPEEVAHLVAWLCSDASRFNTGAIFDMSGGRARY